MTPEEIEQESTDAGKVDNNLIVIESAGGPITVRVRERPDPVLTRTCRHCETPFWFKKSHGYRTHDGKYALWRVECGWCSKPQYMRIDEDDKILEE